MPLSVALSAAASSVAAFFTANKILAFIIKAGVLFGASYLLRPRQPDPGAGIDNSRIESFSSGPARWVVGRQKVGGVVMFWGEDWDVKGTERRNESKGGADDLHLVIALSEGDLEGIEAVFIGSDRFDVKVDENGIPLRYGEEDLPANLTPTQREAAKNLLPYVLDPEVNAYFNEVQDAWYESDSPGARRLDPENSEEDRETIRKAGLAGAISVFPYLNGTTTDERWQSLRHYTDDLKNPYLRVGRDLNNETRELPFADKWTTDHKLQGIAGVHVRLRQWVKHNFDQNVFRGGLPNISFLVKGIRITHPDPNGSGDITQWTDNAAAIRYWWHTQRRGISPANIDRASFVSAYRVCDERILPERPTSWPDGVEPSWASNDEIWGFKKYGINGVVSSGDNPAANEEDFDRAWQGQVVEDGGKLFYYPGVDRPASGTVNETEILDFPEIAPAPAMSDRINAVSISMRQSSFHDYNGHALNEISDNEKRNEVDKGFHLPQDLGEWKWVINPAAAYSLALINLRRARFATTITLHIAPGDDVDPVKYLNMTPGLVYTINFPKEGLEGRRMILQQKQIQEDLTVVCTFLDAPLGLYESNYELPKLLPRPPYTPTRQGERPIKPTNLRVSSQARSSNDGSVYFRIAASVDDHPLRKVWRLKAGDDEWTATTNEATHIFEVNVPRQIMEVTCRHIDKTGSVSFPIKQIFTPGYEGVVLPTPRWNDAFYHGGTLRMSFQADQYVAGVSGVEVRYTRQDLDDSSELGTITEATWANSLILTTKPVQLVQGQAIVADALINRSGHYNLFARFVSNVSGTEPLRGPISAAREIAIDLEEEPLDTYEAAPDWTNVAYHNLYKWYSTHGNTQGENLMIPDFDPRSVDIIPSGTTNNEFHISTSSYARIGQYGGVRIKNNGNFTGLNNNGLYWARKRMVSGNPRLALYTTKDQAKAGGATGIRDLSAGANKNLANVRMGLDLDSVPFDVWNGYVDDSAVSWEPYARWPFGRCAGFGETLDSTNRNASTGLLRPTRDLGGDSTWLLTPPVSLGSSKRVDVRAEAYAFAPGTDAISNITFGGIVFVRQSWRTNRQITPVVLPAVSVSSGTVTYSITGLPTGLSFDPATRTLSGTPSLAGSNAATYTAVDSLQGSVSLNMPWSVSDDLVVPAAPTGLKASTGGVGYNDLRIEWLRPDSITNYFELQYEEEDTSPSSTIVPVWSVRSHLTDLDPETTYSIRVRGVNGAGAGPWSSDSDITTLAEPTAPTIPGNLQVTSRSQVSASFRWDSVSGANQYALRWKPSTDSNYPPNLYKAFSSTVGQIDDLSAETTYNVQVRGINDVGDGNWSNPITFTTRSFTDTGFDINITTHSYGDDDPRPYLEVRTPRDDNNTERWYGTDIAVTLLRDQQRFSLPTHFYDHPNLNDDDDGPFIYRDNVGPGGTYEVRVRKYLSAPSGIGVAVYTDWVTQTLTFGGVPAKPITPRNIDNPPQATRIQFRITRANTATRYRIRYWKEGEQDQTLQTTFNDSGDNIGIGNTTFSTVLEGLATERTTYNYTIEAWNTNGWSLPSNVGSTTIPKQYLQPPAPTGLIVQPISSTSMILAWDKQEDVERWEIETRDSPILRQTGIPGASNTYIFEGLSPSTNYRFRIRGYQSRVPSPGSKNGVWANFTQRATPAPQGTNPYQWGPSPLTFAANASNPRAIDWTFTTPITAGVVGLQIRYGLQYEDNGGTPGPWIIAHENLYNVTFSNVGDTLTGTFDPGLSDRVWVGQVRLLINPQAGLSYDSGFTQWAEISNRATLDNGAERSQAYRNGVKPLETTTPVVTQQTINGKPALLVQWDSNYDDWEYPNATDGSSRNEVRITYNGRVRKFQQQGMQYPEESGNNRTYRWFHTSWDGKSFTTPAYNYTQANQVLITDIRREISISPYYQIQDWAVGDEVSVQIARHEPNRPSISSSSVSYTIVDPAEIAPVSFTPIVYNPDITTGRDVKFSWKAVPGAIGYEVELEEDELGELISGWVNVQSNDVREYTKHGGINETFTIRVRPYRGTGANRVYGAWMNRPHDPTEVGKILGLRASASGNNNQNLTLTWKIIEHPTANYFRYEREIGIVQEDGTIDWDSPHVVPTTDHGSQTASHTITLNLSNYEHANAIIRLRAFRFGANNTKIYSNSYAQIHWVPTPTTQANGTLNPINELVAGSYGGHVKLDWSAPTTDTNHPAATRYRIQKGNSASGPWTNVQSGIAGTITSWEMAGESSGTTRWYRVRPETFELNGAWTRIIYTADTAVSVGQVQASGSATYTTVSADWAPVANAQTYDVQYRPGTSGTWITAATGVQDNEYTISGLDTGSHYQERVRGVAGGSAGEYSAVIDVDTLGLRNLPAPTGLTISAVGNNIRLTWDQVNDATGYHVRIDAKLSSETNYLQYRDVIVRNYPATSTSVEISRSEFGQNLAYEEIDVRVRIKSNFFDSPTSNYSPYSSIRWTPGAFIVPIGNPLLATTTLTPSGLTVTQIVTGVNGSYNFNNPSFRELNVAHAPLSIRYLTPIPGVYTFRMAPTVSTNNPPESQLALLDENGELIQTVASNTNGECIISYNITSNFVYLRHLILGNTTSTAYTLTVNGPPLSSVPLRVVLGSTQLVMNEGGNDVVDVKLNRLPVSNTTITITSSNSDITTSPSTLTFTPQNFNINQRVTVSASLTAEVGDAVSSIRFTGGSEDNTIFVTVLDPLVPQVIFQQPANITINEGAQLLFPIRLSQDPGAGNTIRVRLPITSRTEPSIPDFTPFPADGTTNNYIDFTSSNWNSTNERLQTTARSDTSTRTNGLATIRPTVSFVSGSGILPRVTEQINVIIRNTTRNTVGITLSTTTLQVAEGQSETITARLSGNPGLSSAGVSNIVVGVSSNDTSALTVSPATLTFTDANWSVPQSVTLTGEDDSDAVNETVTVSFSDQSNSPFVGNSSALATIIDNDTNKIILNPSQSITFEEGSTKPIAISLSSRPTGAVTLTISSGNSRITTAVSTVTFNQSNWNTPVNVNISTDDVRGETYSGNISFTATGGGYNNVNASITVNVTAVKPVFSTTHFLYAGYRYYDLLNKPNGTITGDTKGDLAIRDDMVYTGFSFTSVVFTYRLYFKVPTSINSLTINFIQNPGYNINIAFLYVTDNNRNTAYFSKTNYTGGTLNNENEPGFFSAISDSTNICRLWVRYSTPNRTNLSDVGLKINISYTTSGAGGTYQSAASEAQAAIGAVGKAGTGETITLAPSEYSHVEEPAPNPAIVPAFDGYIPTQCWLSGSAIDNYQLPPIIQGLAPYTIEITGLPAGLSFDEATRTISGTPTDSSPLGGTATIILSDANNNTDTRYMDWAITGPTPAGWSDISGGIGRMNNPFQITCNTRGNIRPLLWTGGATNAHDIENDLDLARNFVVWFKCPTTLPHTARISGVGGDQDFDLVVKVGDDWYWSDTPDDKEFLSVPGHTDGALIGVYRYASTTTSVGSHNTGDPITLEWFTDVQYLPTESGAVGLAADGGAEVGANTTGSTPGKSDTDIYLLHRNQNSGAWTRSTTPLPVGEWYDVGTNAQQIRFEVHLKSWENRALRRFTSFHRDRE